MTFALISTQFTLNMLQLKKQSGKTIDGMAYTWQQVAHLLQLSFLYCARILLNPQELHYLKRGATA